MNDDPHLRQACRQQIETLVQQTLGVVSASVVSGDGFEVASLLRDDISGDKLAAMASSLLALSEAVVQELRMNSCRNIIIESDRGHVVALRIPASEHELLLCVLCNDSASLGAVLFAARSTAQDIGLGLEQRADA